MIAQEKAFLAAQEECERLMEHLSEAAREGEPLHEVEGNLWERLLRIGRLSIQGYVEAQGDGDVGETLQLPDGRRVKRQEELHERRYVSVFGEVKIRRRVYGSRKKQKFEAVPLDARLELPESDFSYLLQDWDQSFCVQNSFEGSSTSLERILRLRQSVRSLEHMNHSLAEEVESFRSYDPYGESQPACSPEEEGELMVVMADGKGIPMVRQAGDSRPADPKHLKKGEKKNKKRMACVGASYTVAVFPRTAQDVMDEVLRQKSRQDRPKPQHKRLRAELTREVAGEEVNGKERTFKWLGEEIAQRNPEGKKRVVFLSDGDSSLEEYAEKHLGCEFVSVLDLMHATPRLWDAAHCFHAEGSPEADAFVETRLERLLRGEVDFVNRGLRQMASKRGLRGSKAKALAQVTHYYERNRERMQYDEYLAAGYPIGTGPVEGACRNLVKDRFERTGMRWSVEGAQAMLDLRATYLNDDWNAFCQFHIDHEISRLYPYREAIQKAWLN